MIRVFKYLIVSGVASAPLFALAQSAPRTLQDLIGRFVGILNALIPLLFGIALIGFLWGVVQFILQADSEEKRADGRKIMIWGAVGLFMMTAIWGIVLLIGDTFGIRFVNQIQYPLLPGTTSTSPGLKAFDYILGIF